MNKRIALPLIIILLVAWAATIFYYEGAAYFQGAQEDLPYYVGAPHSYSYLLDSNGTHYFAYNGTTGHLDYSGTNASQIINNAISNSEGVVHLPYGTYSLSASILLDNKTTIEGEGFGTKLQLADGVNDAVIKLANDKTYASTIRNLLIAGNYAGQTSSDAHGIYFNNTDFLNPDVSGNVPRHVIDNVMVRECKGDGVKIEGYCRELTMHVVNAYDNNGTGFNLADGNVTDGKWESCVAGANNEYGFNVVGGCNQLSNCKSFGNDLDGFYITGWYNIFDTCVAQENQRHGFQLYGDNCYSNQIVNCIMDTNNYAHTSVGSGVCVNATDVLNRIEGNTIMDILTPKYQIGIYLLDTNYTVVMDNEVNFNLHRVNVTNSYYTQWFHNYGFLTENGGLVSGTSPIYVAHGLAIQPGWVILSFRDNAANKTASWETYNSTHFVIYHNHGASANLAWEAYCQP